VLVASGGLGKEVSPLLKAVTLPGAEYVLPQLRLLNIWQAGVLQHDGGIQMGEIRDKTRNAGQAAKGKTNEVVGKSTGNRKLESKGKAEKTKAKVKETGEKVKDVFR
jgi:uncharacterized protein YjbJ (UPF0337 family)